MQLSRRHFIGTGIAVASATLIGCTPNDPTTASFLQPWQSHLDWTREQWQQRLQAMYGLGCRELFVQWTGIDGEDPAKNWMLPETQITQLLNLSNELGMGVHLGLPYDERWWKLLSTSDATQAQAILELISAKGVQFMQAAPWPRHAAFRGWYIPYELEQYHWADPARIALLARALQPLAHTAHNTSGQVATVSTYFSVLPTSGSLVALWSTLLDQLPLHPMIQDGVGVAGMRNYDALEPLQQMLRGRKAPFDLIIELFEQLPSKQADGSDFQAHSASFSRVKSQWRVAQSYGAQRVVAFALDPWVLGDMPEAQRLRTAWQDAVRAQQR